MRPTADELYAALTELQSSAAACVQGLETENRVLRAALEKIVNRVPWQGRKDFDPGDEGLADYWAWVSSGDLEIARAALKEVPKDL